MNPEQLASLKLEKIANNIPNLHRYTPEELEAQTNISQSIWLDYLNKESTRQLINKRTAEDIEFAQRKALLALTKEAQRGNVQAIKEINQISGILNQNNNKQFITHYIPRPAVPPKHKEVMDHDMPEL